MRTLGRTLFRSGGLLLVVAGLMIVSALAASAAPPWTPARAPLAAVLPATTCGLVGSTRTCNLYAKTGTLSLPAGSVPASVTIWGYSATSAGAATLPGPTLIVNQGEAVDIILTNGNIPSATSLGFPGQARIPDTTGVTAGNSTTYSFSATALQPGTYLYEAGPTANGPTQVAMGLVGALIVRPSGGPGSAYATAASTFNDEAVLVLSEIDPGFNAAPSTFNLRNFAPKYWLINGEAYPDTDPIAVGAAGNKLLLRYVNAGLEHHSMGLLGLRQTVLATDGKPYPFTYRTVAETIPAGATLDTITTIPAAAPAGTQYALYEVANHLDNNGARTVITASPLVERINFGGMLTFVTVGTPLAPCTPTTDTQGPTASGVNAAPNPTNGTVTVALTASVSDVASCGSNISAAEYYIDTIGANGSGIGMAATDSSFDSPTEAVNATLSLAQLSALSSGNHTLYVHGQDAAGNWGPVASTILNLDKLGPATNSLLLTPNPTNGLVNVVLDATGSDVSTGNHIVDAAEYGIDACPAGGSGIAMTQNTPPLPATATIVHFVATILATTVNGLAEGDHTVYVHSHDAVPGTPPGNWGACSTITLHVDKTAPNTSGVNAEPNPTNGTIGVLVGDFLQEKLTATVSDPVSVINSNIKATEGFIDTVGANGTGIVFIPNDAVFNSPTESVYAAFQLFGVQALTQGRHTIYVHAQDAAGNWGAMSTAFLDVDKTGPTTSASAAPNPTGGATSVTLSGSATDPANTGTPASFPASSIVAAEWFDGADPGAGLGNAMTGTFGGTTVSNLSATINTSGLSFGTHNIGVRAKDVAGNWGPATVVLLNVTPADSIFADGFESGTFAAWSSAVNSPSRITVTGAGAMVGTQAMQAVISGGTSGYVQDNSPVTTNTAYRARFYFNPNNTTTATGQQHDIFVALNSSNLTVFRIQYRRSSSSGNAAQVRAVVTRSGGTTTGAWFTINTNSANVIEVAWLVGSSTTFTLFTNGTAHNLTGLNTSGSSLRIDAVRLGPQVGAAPVSGSTPGGTVLTGASGTEYFDAFVSRKNNTLIGP